MEMLLLSYFAFCLSGPVIALFFMEAHVVNGCRSVARRVALRVCNGHA
jgi:hypothetical protein